MPDLSGTIGRLKTGTYTVTRRTPAASTLGRAQAPSTATISVDACIQPASGRQLQRLPDGMRESEVIVIFSVTELKTKTTAVLPDLIAYKSGSYEVQSVKPFDDSGNYFESLAVKVG
jgi:hypothetical protein